MTGLDAVGLTELDSEVYHELVLQRSAEPEHLAAILGLPRDAAERAFERLEAKGLVSRSTGPSARLIAAPPEAAIEALVLGRQASLERARLTASELGRVYRSSPLGRKSDELVEITVGRDAIVQRFEQLQTGVRRELLTFTAAPFVVPLHVNDIGLELLNRGVDVRSIYEVDALESEGAIDHVRRYAAAGEQSRVIDSLPIKLLIADRELALVPIDLAEPDVEPGCAIVHRCSLLDALIRLFEALWAAGRPLSPGLDGSAPTQVSEDDRELLTLLLAGVPDSVIARQLDISSRTLQRRITAMIRAAGVSSRLQLGWHAATQGWLS